MRGADGHDELDRRFARSLMEPLEERVLRIRPALAPQRGRRRPAQRAAVAPDALAIALEHELLQIGRQPKERLRVGNHDALGVVQMGGVPPPGKTEQHRQVALERRRAKVRVCARRTGEELGKAIPAQRERNRQTGR
jgi:hypothetical protein